jgi:hypothetical protein
VFLQEAPHPAGPFARNCAKESPSPDHLDDKIGGKV